MTTPTDDSATKFEGRKIVCQLWRISCLRTVRAREFNFDLSTSKWHGELGLLYTPVGNRDT